MAEGTSDFILNRLLCCVQSRVISIFFKTRIRDKVNQICILGNTVKMWANLANLQLNLYPEFAFVIKLNFLGLQQPSSQAILIRSRRGTACCARIYLGTARIEPVFAKAGMPQQV